MDEEERQAAQRGQRIVTAVAVAIAFFIAVYLMTKLARTPRESRWLILIAGAAAGVVLALGLGFLPSFIARRRERR